MRGKETGKAQYRPIEMPAEEAERQSVSGVRMQFEMVVREDVILPFHPDGETVGQILDNHLMDLAKHGGEPRSFTFTFDEETWKEAKPLYEHKWQERDGVFMD